MCTRFSRFIFWSSAEINTFYKRNIKRFVTKMFLNFLGRFLFSAMREVNPLLFGEVLSDPHRQYLFFLFFVS